MTQEIYLRAKNIGLDLPTYTQEQRTIKASVGVLLQAAFQPPKRMMRTTLDGIDFDLEPGDRLAVLGRNGAGKSTLLKVLVGAYPPTRGTLEVSGARQALLNLGLGFNQEATLVENILLRGIAMGLKAKQAHAIVDEVLDFAELKGKAGDRLRTLSSGQRMRLGFALATAVQHEILIMDEWIGTGDAGFVKKAQERMQSRVDSAQIVVLASHNFSLLESVCNKAILLEAGSVIAAGPVAEVLVKFRDVLASPQTSLQQG
ncbi:ATP-binding cassette domain-containing protein [uncultured Stenotrophomonas sp.]|uniref:ABC transporter ATP-binding protein n=1 Tax=uncultured Stenotrophomonas sp. TaxID=165438 RepID=UPI0025D4BBC1|nr:ATP-binding cassette domain-containing protein [uncultured Stenotrophomonas sp.]